MEQEKKKTTVPLDLEWWITPSDQNNMPENKVSTLHITVRIEDKQIEISREAPQSGFEEMDDAQIQNFVVVELFNRFYPRQRK